MNKLLGMFAVVFSLAAVPASAQMLFAATGSNGVPGVLYTINPANGAVVSTIGAIKVGAPAISLTGLAFHPFNGTLYGVTAAEGNMPRSLVTVNISTAVATLIGSSGGLGVPLPAQASCAQRG